MPENKSVITSTYKSAETEEFLDKIFYRPIGYVMAKAAQFAGMSPNTVTIISIFIGVAAGHFFYYEDLTLNIYGMLLLMIAEAMDSADGQLARITNKKSKLGRILDGFSTNLWFLSIYIHLALRIVFGGGSLLVFLVALIAGISHSLQSAIADYFRNYYFYFVIGKAKCEIDESAPLREDYKKLTWSRDFFKKFLMRVYVNYTVEQELFTWDIRELHTLAKRKYGDVLPDWLKESYRDLCRPLVKYFNILTTNTRMIVLFITLFLNIPTLYWIFELTVLNALLVYVIIRQSRQSQYLVTAINNLGSAGTNLE